jgi:hypothetical protein
MSSVRSRATENGPSPGSIYRRMKLVVSSAVLGEKSATALSNHRFNSSLTVPLAGATPLPSAVGNHGGQRPLCLPLAALERSCTSSVSHP